MTSKALTGLRMTLIHSLWHLGKRNRKAWGVREWDCFSLESRLTFPILPRSTIHRRFHREYQKCHERDHRNRRVLALRTIRDTVFWTRRNRARRLRWHRIARESCRSRSNLPFRKPSRSGKYVALEIQRAKSVRSIHALIRWRTKNCAQLRRSCSTVFSDGSTSSAEMLNDRSTL